MPTGSKLIAAICLAILGAIAAEMTKPLMPEGMNFGNFTVVTAVIGVVVGWFHLGPRAGGTVTDAINNGITAGVLLVFLSLFVFSCTEMIEQSLRHRYSELMEAMIGLLEIGIDYAQYLLDMQLIATLIVGAILSGLFTEYADRHWR